MRQVGIVAAAGHYALDHHLPKLAEDHRRARTLSDTLIDTDKLRNDARANANQHGLCGTTEGGLSIPRKGIG